MRIVLVYNYLPTHLGGIETTIDAAAREYARRGHHVTVFGADIPELNLRPKSNDYVSVGAPALNILEERLGIPMPIPHPRFLRDLYHAVSTADLIHGHGFLCPPTLAAFAFARLSNPRATRLLTEHVGHVPYDSAAVDRIEAAAVSSIGRATVKLAHGATILNTRVGAELRQLSPSTPVEWIPNGVDLDLFRPPSPDERAALRHQLGWDERPRALFVGRMVAKKGAHIAVRAAELADGAFELVLAGPGAPNGPSPRNVTYLGPLPPQRVAELYRAADALLLPSMGEGFPVTAQEALASGLPVFLGEDPSYQRYEASAGGALFQVPRNAEVIATRLQEFFASPRTPAERERGIEAVRELFSWSNTVSAYEEFATRVRRTQDARHQPRQAA